MESSPLEYCCISVAGNLHPERSIPDALEKLHEICPVVRVSTFYRTAALKRPDQPDYLNGAASILFTGQPRTLKYDILRPIEESLGRLRTTDAYAARPIDLDVVLCGRLVLREPDLTIPDPDIRERVFLAAALLELNPDAVLPDTNTSIKELFSESQFLALTPDAPFSRALKERFNHEY